MKPLRGPCDGPDPTDQEEQLIDKTLKKCAAEHAQAAKQASMLLKHLGTILEAAASTVAEAERAQAQRKAELAYRRRTLKRPECGTLTLEWSPTMDELSCFFAAVANPIRLQILAYFEAVSPEATLLELTKHTGLKTGPLQFHIQTLVSAGLLATERVDRTNYFSLSNSILTKAAYHYLWLTQEMRPVYLLQYEEARQAMAKEYTDLLAKEEAEEDQEQAGK